MKKNIAIAVLCVFSILSILYSLYWRSEANRNYEMALEQHIIAEKNQEEAMRQRLIAEEQVKRCEEQMRIFESNARGAK